MSVLGRRRVLSAVLAALAALAAFGAAAPSIGTVAASTPPTTVAASAPPTTVPTTTTPPVDRLAGVAWLSGTYPSPCSDETVELLGGTAVTPGGIVALEDVHPLSPADGTALALLSCSQRSGVSAHLVAVVAVDAAGASTVLSRQALPGDATIVAFDGTALTVETPDGEPLDGSCCAPFVRRRDLVLEGTTLTPDGKSRRSAADPSAATPPALGGNAALVRAAFPPAALCYRWGNSSFWPQDPPPSGGDEAPIVAPSAELQTMRLALITLTGQWFAPSPDATSEMGAVARAYQESRGLTVDGVVGPQTSAAVAADLGCPPTGSFRQVDPPALGPRRFATVDDLLAATTAYATTGASGNPSLDALLAASSWDGANSMFLGCTRRESPRAGLTCSWSGATPLQLVGLVDDPDAAGVAAFSVLYARSAAAT